jgi:hypothetical protein
VQDFRKLVVWQRAHQFALAIYTATASFPTDERYGLTSQIRRETNGELTRFLYIALGSANEVDYRLRTSIFGREPLSDVRR